MDPEKGIYNGICIVIIYMTSNILKNKILSGDFVNEKQFILCIKFNISLKDFPYIVICLQFPVRLYFNITVNKLQRQFFSIVAVDLQSQVFFHGQFYIAMSRVKDIKQ